MTSSIKGFGPVPKKSVRLLSEKGLPIGVAMAKDADGKVILGFDPGFKVEKAKSMVKKKQYTDLFGGPVYSRKLVGWTDYKMGSATGRAVDWQTIVAQWQQGTKWNPMYLNTPRGYGKTITFSNVTNQMADALMGFGEAAEKATTGLEKLQEANSVWEKKLRAAEEEAHLAITDERVYTFMEQYYLPEDYARRLLEEAYKDNLLNEGKTVGEE